MVSLSSATLVTYSSYTRQLVIYKILKNNKVINCPGVIVEVDEFKLQWKIKLGSSCEE